MNGQDVGWWTPMLATDAPLLPFPWLLQMWLKLGWAVATAWLGGQVVQRLMPRRTVVIAMAALCAIWAWLPGSYSSSFWLGLAFQMPSISTVLLCAVLLWRLVTGIGAETSGEFDRKRHWLEPGWAMIGVALSVCLALDTFALFPVALYAWGFSGIAVVMALVLCLLPWVFSHHDGPHALHWIAALAVAVFVVFRLPSGNLWDAVVDPWLGFGLAVYLARCRVRGRLS